MKGLNPSVMRLRLLVTPVVEECKGNKKMTHISNSNCRVWDVVVVKLKVLI